MRLGLVLRREDAGAFERDIDLQLLPRKLGRILDRRYLHRAASGVDRVAGDFYLMRKSSMYGVIAKKMCVRLHRSEIVQADDLDVVAARLDDGAQNIAADTAEAVDPNSKRHSPASMISSVVPLGDGVCHRLGCDSEILV